MVVRVSSTSIQLVTGQLVLWALYLADPLAVVHSVYNGCKGVLYFNSTSKWPIGVVGIDIKPARLQWYTASTMVVGLSYMYTSIPLLDMSEKSWSFF